MIWARTAAYDAWASNGPSRAFALPGHETPFEAHASYGTVLAQIVASYQTRAVRISPGCALHAPLSGCAYGWPGGGFAISPQSRCARFDLDAGEIASRLQIRHQATHRRNRIAERAEHALEISRTPGFDRRRRTGRERWCFTHPVHTARLARLSLRAQRTRGATRPPFWPTRSVCRDWRLYVHLRTSLCPPKRADTHGCAR